MMSKVTVSATVDIDGKKVYLAAVYESDTPELHIEKAFDEMLETYKKNT